MSILSALNQRKGLILLASLGLGVAGYEWYQVKNEGLVGTASAKGRKPERPAILAEGRFAAYPGAEVTLSAERAGRLSKLGVKERDRVKTGDLVAELDMKEQRAALNEAWSRVKEAEGDIAYLGREKGRSQLLFAQSVVAQASLDKSVHDADSAERRRASLLASASRLRAEVDKASIVAPIDGTVTHRFADAGEFVAAGAPLVTIADLSRLRVEAEVGEFDAGRVRVGAPATIRAEGYDGKRWRGSVEEIPDAVVARQLRPLDPARPVDTRVLMVKIRLGEPVPLRLGQRVEVDRTLTPVAFRPFPRLSWKVGKERLMNRTSGLIVVSGALLLACNQKASGEATPAPSAAAAVPSAVVAAPASAPPAPSKPQGLFADKLPAGLAPVDVAPLPIEQMTKSTSVDTDGDKARKAKDYAKAKQLYVDALKIDPGNHGARWNLARTLVLDRQIEPGLGVLDQLYRAEGCYSCQGLLLKAAQEKDFKGAADRAEFKERTEGVGKELPTFRRAGEMLIKWLDKPTLDNLPPLVDSRTFIVLEDSAGFHRFKGAKAFLEYVDEKKNYPKGRKWGGTLGPPSGMSLDCKNECCEVNTYDPSAGRSVLRQLCFVQQGMVATALYRIKAD